MSKSSTKAKAAAATTAPEREVVKSRPRKGDHGHTPVERVAWITRGGNARARVTCQCGASWEAYGDRADNSHAKHRDEQQPES
jgi:hypothetical protein